MDSGRGERCFSSKHYILKCNQSKENSSKKCLFFCRNLVNCIRYKFSEFSIDGSLKIKANTLREICLLGAYLVFLSQTVADCSPLHSKTLDICEIYYKLTNSTEKNMATTFHWEFPSVYMRKLKQKQKYLKYFTSTSSYNLLSFLYLLKRSENLRFMILSGGMGRDHRREMG